MKRKDPIAVPAIVPFFRAPFADGAGDGDDEALCRGDEVEEDDTLDGGEKEDDCVEEIPGVVEVGIWTAIGLPAVALGDADGRTEGGEAVDPVVTLLR